MSTGRGVGDTEAVDHRVLGGTRKLWSRMALSTYTRGGSLLSTGCGAGDTEAVEYRALCCTRKLLGRMVLSSNAWGWSLLNTGCGVGGTEAVEYRVLCCTRRLWSRMVLSSYTWGGSRRRHRRRRRRRRPPPVGFCPRGPSRRAQPTESPPWQPCQPPVKTRRAHAPMSFEGVAVAHQNVCAACCTAPTRDSADRQTGTADCRHAPQGNQTQLCLHVHVQV